MNSKTIDRINEAINEGAPHIGSESEGISIDRDTLEVVHQIQGSQATQAIKQRLTQDHPNHKDVPDSIAPDIPETTVETNPDPLRSPISVAMAQRLMAILIDNALQDLSNGQNLQLLNGVALRPPNTTTKDASTKVPFWKQIYYEYQIKTHGDKVAAAAGDHLNLSAPWMDQNTQEVSKKMIEMTARMRLIASALSIGLTAASPLHYYANGGGKDAKYGTSITPWESARLGHVWPNRTIMDVADLYRDPISFRKTMDKFRRKNVLKSGRDIWLPVRAQPDLKKQHQELPELCEKIGLDLTVEDHRNQVHDYLMASFQFGPNNPTDNPFSDDPNWQKIEHWRQQILQDIKDAPRNRVELRTMETPPAFDDQTPYDYIKAVYSFFELLFIYLSQNPEFVQNLEYDSINLQTAKSNESAVLLGGMDTQIQWIPRMTMTTPRDLLQTLLDRIKDLASGLGRTQDLETLNHIVQSGLKTPAERIRQEVGQWYDININQRHNPRLLPDDSYPKHLLARTRNAMSTELSQIQSDLQRIPQLDRPYIENLFQMVQKTLTK